MLLPSHIPLRALLLLGTPALGLFAAGCSDPDDLTCIDDQCSTSETGTGTTSDDTTSTSAHSPTTLTTQPTTSPTDTSSTTSSSTTDDTTTTTGMPVCGDGMVDEDETCDEAGETPTCDDDCSSVECGDGNLNEAAGELCDQPTSTADCEAATCRAPVCGDGEVNPLAGEECDDGNADGDDGCSSDCYREWRVFVSSEKYEGNDNVTVGLNGLNGADAKCQELATQAGLAGTYKAWLSTKAKRMGEKDENPANRFGIDATTSKGPYMLPDGTLVAMGWADLTDGTLAHAIDQDENGVTVMGSAVWTNTKVDGTTFGVNDCGGWTMSAGVIKSQVGYTTSADKAWTEVDTQFCSSAARIYCFQVE